MSSSNKQLTILTIDDDPITLETIIGFLEIEGHQIITAINGAEGVNKFLNNNIDIVLTDLQMPEMNGLEVLEKIKQIQEEIPVVVVSGAGDLSDSIEAFRLGAWDYIQKPIDFPLLINSISRAWERTHLIEENGRYRENLEDQIRDRTIELHNRTNELENTNFQLNKEIDHRQIAEREKQSMEEEVRKAKNLESLGSLAGGIAHDFNNLLAALVNYIDYAKLDAPQNSSLYDTLESAKTVTEMAADLTQQLLTFSKGGSPKIQDFDLHELIKESINPSSQEVEEINFCVSLPDSVWPIRGDKNQIGIIIRNILYNSIESMPNGGKILIAAEDVVISDNNHLHLPSGNYVKVTVSDEGEGISKDDIKKIFDPYFTTKGMDSKKGKGLGLAVSYSIIKKHGGKITISSAVGHGTTVSIHLPAA